MRLSGLEPFNSSNEKDYRKTFINLGERCNVAGSTIFKKAIVDGNYEKALEIALKQVETAPTSLTSTWMTASLTAKACMTKFVNLMVSEPDIAKRALHD